MPTNFWAYKTPEEYRRSQAQAMQIANAAPMAKGTPPMPSWASGLGGVAPAPQAAPQPPGIPSWGALPQTNMATPAPNTAWVPEWVRAGIAGTSLSLGSQILRGKPLAQTGPEYNPNILEKIGSGLVSILADPLTYLSFGVGGIAEKAIASKIAGSVVKAGIGFGAMEAGKSALSQQAYQGRISPGAVAEAGVKGAVLGGLTGGAGGLATRAGVGALGRAVTEAGVMGGAGPSIQEEKLVMPRLEDFVLATAPIVGMHAAGLVSRGLFKLAVQQPIDAEEFAAISKVDPVKRAQIADAAVQASQARAQEPGRGKLVQATGADPNKPYDFQYKVVELDDLVASNTPSLGVNPAYPKELQGRVRERAASRVQIENIAQNLNPAELLTESRTIDRGPMIVGADNAVESGNGRTLALQLARTSYPEQWQAYQDTLRRSLADYGIAPESIAAMKSPVLVRERISAVDRVAFSREANEATTLAMSPFEQAMEDARRLPDAVVGWLETGKNQSIEQSLTFAANRPIVQAFITKMAPNERAAMVGPTGELNPMGLSRLKTALFAKTYGGEAGRRLTQSFSESLDPGVKRIEQGMLASLPQLSKVEALIRSGGVNPEYSVAEDMSKAVDMLARLRSAGTRVDFYLAQIPMGEAELTPFQSEILRFLAEAGNSPKRIREFLAGYAQEVEKLPLPGQTSMFGEVQLPSKEAISARLIQGQTPEAGPLFGQEAVAVPPTAGAPARQELAQPSPQAEVARPGVSGLPEMAKLPERGQFPAIQTDEGSIYADTAIPPSPTHLLFAQKMGIPQEAITSGGWINEGVYEPSYRSEAATVGERARLRGRVAAKREATLAIKPEPAPQGEVAPTMGAVAPEVGAAGPAASAIPSRVTESTSPLITDWLSRGWEVSRPKNATEVATLREMGFEQSTYLLNTWYRKPTVAPALPEMPKAPEAQQVPVATVAPEAALVQEPAAQWVPAGAKQWQPAATTLTTPVAPIYGTQQPALAETLGAAKPPFQRAPIQGAPPPPATQPPLTLPPGMRTPTPSQGSIVIDLGDYPRIEAMMNIPNRQRALTDWAVANIPFARNIVKVVDPAVLVTEDLPKNLLTYKVKEAMGRRAAEATANMMRGRFGDLETLFADLKDPVNDIMESKPGTYKFNATQEAAYNYWRQTIDETTAMLKKYGVNFRELTMEPGKKYSPRHATPAAAVKAGAEPRGARGGRVGTKQTFQKTRFYETQAAGVAKGVEYLPALENLEAHLREGYKAINDQQLSDLVKPLGQTVKERMSKAVVAVRESALLDQKALVKLDNLIKRTRRGEQVPDASINANAKRFSDLADRFRQEQGQLQTLGGTQAPFQSWQRTALELDLKDALGDAKWRSAQAGKVYARERERAGSAIYGVESYIMHPAFSGRIFPQEVADAVYGALEGAKTPGLKGITAASNLFRTMGATFDFSAPMLQGLPLLFYNPRIWAKMMAQSFTSFLDPTKGLEFTAQHWETIQKWVPEGLDVGGMPEYYAGMEKGGILGKVVPEPILKQSLGRFSSAFSDPITLARVLLAESLEPMAVQDGVPLSEVANTINYMTGSIGGAARLGIGATQQAVEGGVLLFAPSYTKAAFALMASTLNGGLTSKVALETLGKMMGGGLLAYVVACKALGQPVRLDPSKGGFLSVKVGDSNIGIGSIWVSMARLMAEVGQKAVTRPGDLVALDSNKNPFLRFLRSRSAPAGSVAWDFATGKNWIGQPLETPLDWTKNIGSRLLPYSIEGYITQNPRANLQELPAQLLGMRSSPLSPSAMAGQLQDQYAQQSYGKKWAELSRSQQFAIEQGQPKLQEALKTKYAASLEKGDLVSQFWTDVERQKAPLQREMQELGKQLRAGQITGNNYRDAISQREAKIAAMAETLQNTAKYQKVPLGPVQSAAYYGGKVQPETNVVDQWIDAYYAISENLTDPATGTLDVDKLMTQRENLKANSDPAVVKEAMAYINRNRDPLYVEALEQYRQYQAIPQFLGLTAEQTERANDALRTIRSMRRAQPQVPPATTRALYARSDPEGARLAQVAGKMTNPARKRFWAAHPLLSTFFSDLTIEQVEEVATIGGVRQAAT